LAASQSKTGNLTAKAAEGATKKKRDGRELTRRTRIGEGKEGRRRLRRKAQMRQSNWQLATRKAGTKDGKGYQGGNREQNNFLLKLEGMIVEDSLLNVISEIN
jgi:hypothetical protein